MLAVLCYASSLVLSNVPSLSWLRSGFAKVGQIPEDCCAVVQYITPKAAICAILNELHCCSVITYLQFATAGCSAYEADQKGCLSKAQNSEAKPSPFRHYSALHIMSTKTPKSCMCMQSAQSGQNSCRVCRSDTNRWPGRGLAAKLTLSDQFMWGAGLRLPQLSM